MKRRKSNAEPETALELQHVGKFSDEETEQIIEDLANLLISAWQRQHDPNLKEVSEDEKEP
jgi:hypothetical protein